MAGLGEDGVDVLLTMVGCNDSDRTTIRLEVFLDVQSMRNFSKTDRKDTARYYARRTANNRRIHISRVIPDRLIGMVR